MDLYAINGNPVPPDPFVSVALTRDGFNLRVARWTVRDARGTVLVAMGRSEFIEYYFGVVRDLLARGFEVIVFDWRGQGRSDRELVSGRRGHVSSFAGYGRDLLAVETQILRVFAPRPWFALGHSMGAALLLEQARAGTSPFERLVLSAPMIGIPLRHRAAKAAVIRAMNLAGMSRWPIPGGSERSPLSRPFDDNLLTADREQYDRLAALTAQLPNLTVASPTVRWLKNALDLTRRFEDPRYPVATTLPVLIVAAGADRIVDTAATERFGIRLKAGRCITLPNARHQLLMERADTVAQFWAAFDAFVPGNAGTDRLPAPDRVGRPPLRSRAWRKLGSLSGRLLPGGGARAPGRGS